jgi:hypothetical protein
MTSRSVAAALLMGTSSTGDSPCVPGRRFLARSPCGRDEAPTCMPGGLALRHVAQSAPQWDRRPRPASTMTSARVRWNLFGTYAHGSWIVTPISRARPTRESALLSDTSLTSLRSGRLTIQPLSRVPFQGGDRGFESHQGRQSYPPVRRPPPRPARDSRCPPTRSRCSTSYAPSRTTRAPSTHERYHRPPGPSPGDR